MFSLSRKSFCRAVLLSALVSVPQNADAWWDYGHRVVIEVARRHLEPQVLVRINAELGHDVVEDASWMDEHRRDPELAYAYYWHNCGFVEGTSEVSAEYGFSGGGNLIGLLTIEENLRHFDTLSPANRALLLRMAVHFVGDIHCPAHIFYESHVQKWKYAVPYSAEPVSYHEYYDTFPDRMFEGKTPAEAAALLDTGKPSDVRKAARGSVRDWVRDCGEASLEILEINPIPEDRYAVVTPAPDTWERAAPIVRRQLRTAGYRLAALLNKYLE